MSSPPGAGPADGTSGGHAESPNGSLDLLRSLLQVREDVVRQGDRLFRAWAAREPREEYVESARNLAYYLALRRTDLNALQPELAAHGLLSLDRCEARVLETLDAAIAAAGQLAGVRGLPGMPDRERFDAGPARLERQADLVLGSSPPERRVRIMVTMPAEAASDQVLVRDLVAAGMDLARIRCAHDDADTWAAVARNVRRASLEVGRPVRVVMDLAGPGVRSTRYRVPKRMRGTRLRRDDVLWVAEPGVSVPSAVPYVRVTERGDLRGVKRGHRVAFDGGRLGAVVHRKKKGAVGLHVGRVKARGVKLKRSGDLTLPDSAGVSGPLTRKDREDLPLVMQLADVVSISSVRSVRDVRKIQKAMVGCAVHRMPPLLLAVRRAAAVDGLPDILVQASGRQPAGVLVARRDLVADVDAGRPVEVREALLQVAEAAHVPVVWATPVLDRLVRTGRPTRAEIADASRVGRKACVMLESGPFIREAVRALDGVLRGEASGAPGTASRLHALTRWEPLWERLSDEPASEAGPTRHGRVVGPDQPATQAKGPDATPGSKTGRGKRKTGAPTASGARARPAVLRKRKAGP